MLIRALSWFLILLGAALGSWGLASVWNIRQAEQQAREDWDRQVSARSLHAPAEQRAQPGEALARLSIRSLNSDWVVVEGAGKSELKRGPGHLPDSALPGARGNCVIAGHRDTHFRALRNIRVGDEISVERDGRAYTYRVTHRKVVSPDDTRSLDSTPSPALTLVTCYPFYYVGPAPKRFVVRAELEAGAKPLFGSRTASTGS